MPDDPRADLTPADLRTFRRIANLTQTEIANSLGLSQGTWTNYERGVQPIPASLADGLIPLIPGADVQVERYRQIRGKIV